MSEAKYAATAGRSGRIAGCPSAGGQRSDAVNRDVTRAVRGTGNVSDEFSPTKEAINSDALLDKFHQIAAQNSKELEKILPIKTSVDVSSYEAQINTPKEGREV